MTVDLDSQSIASRWAPQRGVHNQVKAAILAAGLGSRMNPLTVNCLPKPMFPLAGRTPMLEQWVRGMVASGLTNVSMNLCVLPQPIRRHFRDGSSLGARIQYVEETVPSGTLGGVCKQALGRAAKKVSSDEPDVPCEPFAGQTLIVPSGDIVTNFGPALLEEAYDIHKKSGAAFSMILVPVPWERRRDFGTAVLDQVQERKGLLPKSGLVKEFREKDPESPSNLNNASIYFIEMDLLRALDAYRTPADPRVKDPCYDFGKHVFPALLGQWPHLPFGKRFPLLGIQFDGLWFDVGQKRDYLRVNEALLDGRLDLAVSYEKCPWGYCGNNVTIDLQQVKIIPPVVIGDHCVIHNGATLGPYAVIGDGWTVERDARIRQSVLWGRYPFFDRDGRELDTRQAPFADRHLVRRGASVQGSIVVGGTLESEIHEKTVSFEDNGALSVLSIDQVPEGPRA